MTNAFTIPKKSIFCEAVEKPISPQLAYKRRKLALGIHPDQLRKQGLPVIDQRFKKNKGVMA